MESLIPILLVEDDRGDAMIFKRALKDLNISNPMVCLPDCKEALSYLIETNNARPGIILTDLNTPQMNAIEFLKAIKTDDALKKIPIVVFSGSDDEADMAECLKSGAARYMVKPNEYKKLLELINDIHKYWIMSELPDNNMNFQSGHLVFPEAVI